MSREREPAPAAVDAVGQILSNYQAALLLHEAAVDPGTTEEVLAPVLEACAGMPGLQELLAEAMAGERIAATHSRLLRRRPRLIRAAETSPTLATTTRRLEQLEAGSHSAGALFRRLRT